MPIQPAEDRATELFEALDKPFSLPTVDLTDSQFALPSQSGNPLYEAVDRLDMNDLTEGAIGGAGSFDKIMASMKEHLSFEFERGRITGDQYAKAYIELTGQALTIGLQFVMGKELTYWQAAAAREQAKAAEIAAVAAGVQLETAKAQLATQRVQYELVQSQYTLTKLQLASEDARYRVACEQIEAARSQHADTKTDGTPIEGTIRRQRDLLEEQKYAYSRDADARVGKMYLDAWIAQKTVDEGLSPPTELTNDVIDDVLIRMKTRAEMATP